MIDWQVVIKKHGPAVWQTAYRLLGNHTDAADCFQETFICALQISRREPIRNFSALLVRLATARAIDQLRQRLHRSNCKTDMVEHPCQKAVSQSPARQIQQQELVSNLRKALTQLPPQEAQAFCLRYLNDMSYRQIAKELGIKTNAAGVLLHRARGKLRALLETKISEV